ncbi:unnamed protein product [Tilletia controversa]|uniref:SWI5-dependent HO expression protein 3 n=3 Tax=Tilletia TaxID=13289 RepID=A0ABN7IZ34_9BASI|nr:hypothetical protein CF336_g4274 [Tilletia laevis]KAE8196137.1 hypothetical protein CF328_g4225 [Tilletia controversa]CAD6888935.1 unnamed protein product [Tilletia caries]KAE8202206.1 hypothetical protein CF335_g3506 [Tilletia laevis]CAD6897385.1 unnamed protein product [Tilletia controversa]
MTFTTNISDTQQQHPIAQHTRRETLTTMAAKGSSTTGDGDGGDSGSLGGSIDSIKSNRTIAAAAATAAAAVAPEEQQQQQQAARRRVTSLRSAQVPTGSAIAVTDGDQPAPTAIQILAARYSGNSSTSAAAPAGAAGGGGGGGSPSASAGAGAGAEAASPSMIPAPVASSSSSSTATAPAHTRRMSTPAVSLLSPGASSSSSSSSTSSRNPGHPQHYPPSTSLTRPVRRRREAGSLDMASNRANSLTASITGPPSRSASPLHPASTPNGLSAAHEEQQQGRPSLSATASAESIPVGDDDLSSSLAPHMVAAASSSSSISLAHPSQSPERQPQRPPRATSPTPSMTSVRSTATTPRTRRISTASGAPSFAQPTQASEQRRLANMTQLVNVLLSRNAQGSSTAMDDPTHPSKSISGTALAANGGTAAGGGGGGKETTSTKVIHALTTELDAVRSTLDSTSAQLAHAQRSLSALERDRDTLRDSVHRARTEADTLASQLHRKDRSVIDALERARRAEAESHERGRQGREWGARVRAVEDELGRERRERARAEAGYDAVALEWKRTRESWKAEVGALKEEIKVAQEKERVELEALRARVAEVSLLGRAMAVGQQAGAEAGNGNGNGNGIQPGTPITPKSKTKIPVKVSKPTAAGAGTKEGEEGDDEDTLAPFRRVLQGLESERVKMETWAQTHIDSLVSQLEEEEAHRASVEKGLEDVKRELARILRLARLGEVAEGSGAQ